MTRFFEDVRGRTYPASRIRSIGIEREVKDSRAGDHYQRTVFLDDDQTIEIDDRAYEKLVAVQHVVAAAAGLQTLTIHGDSPTADDVTATPIIAWAVGAHGVPTPITPAGMWNGVSNCHLILTSEGRVICPYEGVFATIDEYLAYLASETAAAESLKAQTEHEA